MFKYIREVLNENNAYKVSSLISQNNNLTVTQAELSILAGFALKFTKDHDSVVVYLNYLASINDVQITGVPVSASKIILTNWIIEYYKVLYILISNLEKSRSFILECIFSHVIQWKDEIISKFILNFEKNLVYGVEIEAWSLNPYLSLDAGRSLIQTIYYRYLRGGKIDLKSTEIHWKIISLTLSIIKSQSFIIEEDNDAISEIFALTFKFSNKFLNKKISSKKLFLVCVDYQLYCLTFQKMLQIGLKEFNLKSVYGKYPLINCWVYHSMNLVENLNQVVLFEVLEIYLGYMPDLFEDYFAQIVLGYFDVLEISKEYLHEYSERLMELVIDIMRLKPSCLEIYKSNIPTFPDFIREYAKWSYVYLNLSDEEVPKIVKDSFKRIQLVEEVKHVFSILKNIIPTCDYLELEIILSEFERIPHSFETTEFLCACIVDIIKKLEKLGIFNKHKDIEKRLEMIIRTISEKTKDLTPSKVYNQFWLHFIHFVTQTEYSTDISIHLQKISEKTIWDHQTNLFDPNPQYLHKIKNKIKSLCSPENLSYESLLCIYTNCKILVYQYQYDFFLEYCLNSKLAINIINNLIREYFDYLKKEKYSSNRITKDLIYLLRYIAERPNSGFIKSIINIESISSLQSCYCYEFIQIQSNFQFFQFSLNLLGCASLGKSEVYMHHTNDAIIILNPSNFFMFLKAFMERSIGYGLNIARKEVYYCYVRFLQDCNNGQEDLFSRNFFESLCEKYTKENISYKLYSDLQKFHNWFSAKYNKRKKESSDAKLAKSSKTLEKKPKEYRNELNKFIRIVNNPKTIANTILYSNLDLQEYLILIHEYLMHIFMSESNLSEGLVILDWIFCIYFDYYKPTLQIIRIILLQFLCKRKKGTGEEFVNCDQFKCEDFDREEIYLLVKFLERQFHIGILNKKEGWDIIGIIFEQIISNSSSWDDILKLEICAICFRLSRPEYKLPNAYQLHVLSIKFLFFVPYPDYEKKEIYRQAYLNIMKSIVSIIPTVPRRLSCYSIKFEPDLSIWYSPKYFHIEGHSYNYAEPLMYSLTVSFNIVTAGENVLPSLTDKSLSLLQDFSEVYKAICTHYSHLNDDPQYLNCNYEESKFLFYNRPEYNLLLENLKSPLASARSFAVKHFVRAPHPTQISYVQYLIGIAESQNLYDSYKRHPSEEDIWVMLWKIGAENALCAIKILNSIKLSSIYKRGQDKLIGYNFIKQFRYQLKKHKYRWNEVLDQMNFMSNLWLIIKQGKIREGLKKLFGDGSCLAKNLYLAIYPNFHIKRIGVECKMADKQPVITFYGEKSIKELFFYYNKSFEIAYYYNFVIGIFLSHLKLRKIPIGFKMRKIDCIFIRDEEFGSLIEYLPINTYDHKDIIESYAGYCLIMFMLGVRDSSSKLLVSKNNKIVADSTKFLKPEKHYSYFSLKKGSDIQKFRFWVIAGYTTCREIMENILWIMKENFWKKQKLHFYWTLPLQSAIDKINKRIDKDND